MYKHSSWLSRSLLAFRQWWQRFRAALPEYEKDNLAQWRRWGTRRAEHSAKGLGAWPRSQNDDDRMGTN